MQRRLGVFGDPLEDLFVGLHLGARRNLTLAERGEGLRAKNATSHMNRFDPLAAILCR